MKTKKEVAIQNLMTIGVMGEVVEKFKKGIILRSDGAGPMCGILWALTNEQQKTVKELEDKGNVVYHMIEGTYSLDDERLQMEAYLCITDEDCKDDESGMASITPFDPSDNSYSAFAYVKNITWDDGSEFGDVGIKSVNGGIKRIF